MTEVPAKIMKKALIIVPAYNEESSIRNVLGEISAAASRCEMYLMDVLVVDDCSTDKTREEVLNAGSTVVSLPVNLGIGGAAQTGFRHAMRHGYDYAVQVDGDGQHDPRDIAMLLDALEQENVDFVIGSRFKGDCSYKPSLPRRIGMQFSRQLLYLGTGRRVLDTTSGFRAINRRMIEFFSSNYATMFAGVTSLAMAFRNGFTFVEVPARFHYRKFGTSSIDWVKALFYPFQVSLAVLEVLLRRR